MNIRVNFITHIPSLSIDLFNSNRMNLQLRNATKDNPRLIITDTVGEVEKLQALSLIKELVLSSHFPDITTKHSSNITLKKVNKLCPWKHNAFYYKSVDDLFNCRFKLNNHNVVDLWLNQKQMDLGGIKYNEQRDFWINHVHTRRLRDHGVTNEFVSAQLWKWTEST